MIKSFGKTARPIDWSKRLLYVMHSLTSMEKENFNLSFCFQIKVFNHILSSPFFTSTSIILFLNKIDLFLSKLPRSPLENFCSKYHGGSEGDALNFMKDIFEKEVRKRDEKRTGVVGGKVFSHFTCATGEGFRPGFISS